MNPARPPRGAGPFSVPSRPAAPRPGSAGERNHVRPPRLRAARRGGGVPSPRAAGAPPTASPARHGPRPPLQHAVPAPRPRAGATAQVPAREGGPARARARALARTPPPAGAGSRTRGPAPRRARAAARASPRGVRQAGCRHLVGGAAVPAPRGGEGLQPRGPPGEWPLGGRAWWCLWPFLPEGDAPPAHAGETPAPTTREGSIGRAGVLPRGVRSFSLCVLRSSRSWREATLGGRGEETLSQRTQRTQSSKGEAPPRERGL